jgi:hypothetical protein
MCAERLADSVQSSCSHTALTEPRHRPGLDGTSQGSKLRKHLAKRDFAVVFGTGRDPGLRVRIPLGLNRTAFVSEFVFLPEMRQRARPPRANAPRA